MKIYDRKHPRFLEALRVLRDTRSGPAERAHFRHEAVAILGAFSQDNDCDIEGLPRLPKHLAELERLSERGQS